MYTQKGVPDSVFEAGDYLRKARLEDPPDPPAATRAKSPASPADRYWKYLRATYPHWLISEEIATGNWYIQCQKCQWVGEFRSILALPVESECPRCARLDGDSDE